MTARRPISAEEALAHTEWVSRLARTLAGSGDAAQELAQDAWVAAVETDARPTSELRAWFTGVLRNLAVMRVRTEGRRARREAAAVLEEPVLRPDTLVERLEAQRQVATLVLALSPPLRDVVFLRYYEGLNATEIGQRLGIPAGTARRRLKAGVEALRAQLDAAFDGDRRRWVALLMPTAVPRAAAAGAILQGALMMKLNKTVVALLLAALALALWAAWPTPPARDGGALSEERVHQPQAAPSGAPALPLAAAPAAAAGEPLPAWLGQPDLPRRRVAGRVLADGAPVAGARVRLEAQPVPAGEALMRLMPRPVVLGIQSPERRTAEDGSFDFGEQLPLEHTVSAAAPGFSGVSLGIDLRDPEAARGAGALELALGDCAASLVGRVLDSAGGPIGHARLRPAGSLGVESTEDGAFALCLPPGEHVLHADASGYGAVRLTVSVQGRTARDVVLLPEALLVGHVVDGSGAPVPRALVTALPAQFTGKDSIAGAVALAGPDGRFRLSVAPGTYKVVAASEQAATPAPTHATATVGRESDEVVLRLEERVLLRGHVSRAGKPVAGARVTAIATSGGRRAEAFSQTDGSFVMAGLRRGTVAFDAPPFEVVAPKSFVVREARQTVQLEVKPRATLHGLVTQASKPVPGARVEVSAGLRTFEATSDTSGRYAVKGLPAGRYRVSASSAVLGAFVEEEAVQLADAQELQLDLELRNAATICGRVESARGQSVAGAMVVFTHSETGDEGRCPTDTEGRFRCAQMTGGGTYLAKVFPSASSRTPYAPAAGPFASVALPDGASRVEGLTLAVRTELSSIEGQVVDAEGNPVPDVRLRAHAAGDSQLFPLRLSLPSALSDVRGAFSLEGLTPGTWALDARAPDGAEAVVPEVEAGARKVRVSLRAPGGVEGTLAGYEEPPFIYAQPLNQSRLVAGQVEGSRFRIALPAGVYILSAMNTHEGEAKRVEVRDGVFTQVTMTSRGSAVVSGTVVDHVSRAPVPQLVCHVVSSAGERPGITNWDLETAPVTDEAGRFTVDPAPAGTVHVTCIGDARELSAASAVLTVAKGEKAFVAMEVVKRVAPFASGDIGVAFHQTASAVIQAVRAGSPGAAAGLEAGDVVVAVDGIATAPLDAHGVQALIGNHLPGTPVSLSVLRRTQRRDVTLVTVPEE